MSARRLPKIGTVPGATTFAGLLVTATACLATVLLILTTCVLYLDGRTNDAKEAGALALAVFTATVALLAQTRVPQPPPSETQAVEVVNQDPIPTDPVDPPTAELELPLESSPRPRRRPSPKDVP